MKIVLCLVIACMVGGCTTYDATTVRYFEGSVVGSDGSAIAAWVGVTEASVVPATYYDSIADREKWGDHCGSTGGLTHTDAEGRFVLKDHEAPFSYTTCFGVRVSDTGRPDVPWPETVYVHVHDGSGWQTVCVSLLPEQRSRRKSGAKVLHFGEIVIR